MMKVYFKDVAHLYIGCFGYMGGYDEPKKLVGISPDFFVLEFSNGNIRFRIMHIDEFKPILTQLEGISEMSAEKFREHLKCGVDLFGLIETGQATKKPE